MTYPEFLSILRTTPRKWYLDKEGEIRINTSDLGIFPSSQATGSLTCPGLACGIFGREDFDNRIAVAADNHKKNIFPPSSRFYFDPQIRKDLLEACGLEEK